MQEGNNMPKVKVNGKVKHFPYTKKGMAQVKKAKMMMKLPKMMEVGKKKVIKKKKK